MLCVVEIGALGSGHPLPLLPPQNHSSTQHPEPGEPWHAHLDLGPEHPTRAGLVRLHLTLDDDRITGVDITPGLLHRGAEKLFEVRDYRQVLMLADRHDWQAPFSGELGVALACENLLGLTPPDRATALRTLLAEVARLHSHLGFLTFVPHLLDQPEVALLVREARDRARELMLCWTGNRLHPMLNRLGGLAIDAPDGWFDACLAWLDDLTTVADALSRLMSDEAWLSATATAPLTLEVAQAYGVTGPAARALGVKIDLRLSEGMLNYAALDAGEVLSASPDSGHDSVQGRFSQWLLEVRQSSELVRRAIERQASIGGPVNVPLSKIIKLPDAELWFDLEAPLGVAGFHLVSRGGTTPWRLALRTPTFANVAALQSVLIGCTLDQVGMTVASFGYTIGDLDK